MSDDIILILELIGTIAFAASGAAVGITKKMDIFGIIVLGLTTATGGGIVRDLILGNTPPATFTNPVYAIVSTVVSVAVFLPFIRKFSEKYRKIYDRIMLVMDSIGLAIFTVVGVSVTFSKLPDAGLFLLTFVGCMTGVGGGILRDVFANELPYVFTKHFYACASILGALSCAVLWKYSSPAVAMISGFLITLALRLLAAKYRWSLPKA